MTAIDTSVAVASFARWHEQHRAARDALRAGPRLIAHVAVETFSVLTRLPVPHRAPPSAVLAFLAHNFRAPWIGLPPGRYRLLLERASGQGIVGGAVYDALVAAAAEHAGETLVTLDRRALDTYRTMGAQVQFLAGP